MLPMAATSRDSGARPHDGITLLFGGPARAGKSTLARAWCETRPRAVHIELDSIRALIVAGFADPQSLGPEQADQYAVSVSACAELARVFAGAGYDVAIDDVLQPEAFDALWLPALEGLSWQIIVVLPGLDETLRRSTGRTKRVLEVRTREQHAASLAWPEHLRLDTTGLSVEESLALARERGLLPAA